MLYVLMCMCVLHTSPMYISGLAWLGWLVGITLYVLGVRKCVHVLYHIRCVVCAYVCMCCNAGVYHLVHVRSNVCA